MSDMTVNVFCDGKKVGEMAFGGSFTAPKTGMYELKHGGRIVGLRPSNYMELNGREPVKHMAANKGAVLRAGDSILLHQRIEG